MNRMKDIQLLRNTLSDAVQMVRESGIDAEFTENKLDWGSEFVIRLHN